MAGPLDAIHPFEKEPLSRSEYINAVIHFYRGERARADAWRARLDSTTNWAVVTAGGMLSFSFTQKEHSHVALLLAQLLVMVFLGIEARRFRYFDVWRSRVRMIEENFFIPILKRNLISPREDWREWVSRDLDNPTFKMTFLEAIALRLRFNYLWILLVLTVAWVAKLNLHPYPANDFRELLSRVAVGSVTGLPVAILVLGANVAAIYLAWGWGRGRHFDEVQGIDAELDHWKT